MPVWGDCDGEGGGGESLMLLVWEGEGLLSATAVENFRFFRN
jgi:hypothetical protein